MSASLPTSSTCRCARSSTRSSRCIDAGSLRDVDARHAAISIWAAVHGLVSLEIAGYLDDDQGVLEEHLVASAVYWLPTAG